MPEGKPSEGGDIVVTDAMIAAGVAVLVSCPGALDIPVSFESLAADVYRAMVEQSFPISAERP